MTSLVELFSKPRAQVPTTRQTPSGFLPPLICTIIAKDTGKKLQAKVLTYSSYFNPWLFLPKEIQTFKTLFFFILVLLLLIQWRILDNRDHYWPILSTIRYWFNKFACMWQEMQSPDTEEHAYTCRLHCDSACAYTSKCALHQHDKAHI